MDLNKHGLNINHWSHDPCCIEKNYFIVSRNKIEGSDFNRDAGGLEFTDKQHELDF